MGNIKHKIFCGWELLGSASIDKTMRIWSAGDGSVKKELQGHMDSVFDMAWSSDSHYISSSSDDKTLRKWDVHIGDCIKTLKGHTNYVFCVNFNLQLDLIVYGSFDETNETVRIWYVRTGNA